MVADGAGRVIELNRAAERILGRDDGLIIRNGRLAASGVLGSEKLAKLIADAVNVKAGAAAGRMLVRRRDGGPAYILTIAPLGASLTVQESPLALIVVAGPDAPSPSERELAEFFGLSPAESRLAAALMTGKTLHDVASASGVRITTLRTQLSSILRKVGASRQAELMRVLASIRTVGSPPPDAI